MEEKRAQRRKTKLLIFGLVFLLVIVFFYKLLVPGRLVYQGDLTSSDVTELNFPRRELLGRSLKEGRLPVWTNLIGCGFPLLGEGQTGIFYPPNLLLFWALDPVTAYNLSVILSFILGMLFTFMLARSFERSTSASIFASIAFGLSGFFISRIRFMALINGCSWLPLAHWGMEEFYRHRRYTHIAITGFAMAMQVFAGFVQIFYITALSVACHFLWRFAPEAWKGFMKKARASRKTFVVGLAAILLSFLLAVGMAAVQILPTLEGMKVSNRAGGLKFEEATEFPMKPADLAMFVTPYKFGNPAIGTYNFEKYGIFWEKCAFSGVITILLSLIAILLSRKKEVYFWLVILFLSIIISLGSATPVFKLLWKVIPGMKLFRFPQRFLLVSVLALAMLSGAGLDALARKLRKIFPQKKLIIRVLYAGSIVILVGELFFFGTTQINTIDSTKLLSEPCTVDFLKSNSGTYRVGHIGELESWRTFAYDTARGWHKNFEPYLTYRAMLPPEFNMIFGVEAIGTQGQYGIERVKNLLTWTQNVHYQPNLTAFVPDSSIRILGTENARFVFSQFRVSNRYLEPIAEVVMDKENREIFIYRNLLEQPRAYVCGDYRLIEEPEKESLDSLFGADFDPRRRIILEERPSKSFRKGGSGTAKIKKYGAREVTIEVKTKGGGFLVLSDSFYPGWEARVDGKPKKILRANYAFRAVEVPDGRHTVVFSYTPSHYLTGFAISIFSLLVFIAVIVIELARRKGKHSKVV
ncbi:MAG: YfhO family protein [Actinomycetota bacterium]|nr:YfhO family protein [Actinomycetota bacterium]